VVTTLAVTSQPTLLRSHDGVSSSPGPLAVYNPIRAVTGLTPSANHRQLLLYVSSSKDYE
jgi:hypothetical protein